MNESKKDTSTPTFRDKDIEIPTPPDPPNTGMGLWERRINWAVTIVALALSLYLGVKDSLRPATTLEPTQAPVPAVVAPVPVVPVTPDVPADVSLGVEIGHAAVTVVGVLGAPFACSQAQKADWTAGAEAAKFCLSQYGLGAVVQAGADLVTVTGVFNLAGLLGAPSDNDMNLLVKCLATVGATTITQVLADEGKAFGHATARIKVTIKREGPK